MKLKDSSCKMRAHCYWNINWGNSLKNISCLLPVSEPENGRAFSKKETLIHMLRYFDFLQTHIQRLHSNLPPHYLPQPNDRGAILCVCVFLREGSDSESDDTAHSELCTPPCILKAKRKYSCGRSRKKDTPNSELFDDKSQTLRKEDADRNVKTITNGDCPHTRAADETVGSAEDNSLPCSSDSNYSVSAVLPTTSSSTAGQIVVLYSDSMLSNWIMSFILKDEMFGVLPPSGKTQLDDSPTLPQTPMLPFLPLLGFQEGLNLSPSLLTSPARGLSNTLLPDGQEELQTLFEDVWVTPKPAAPKHCTRGNDSPAFYQSKVEDRHSDDITWSPNQLIHMKKGRKGHHKKASRKGQAVSGPKKKKCVNGFIMFCRMNRRLYLRTHPGLPSTVVTKELANLWCIMPKQERRVYCLKARQFSRQHNRNVRVSEGQEAEEEKEDYVPSPLHILLAHRDLWFTSNAKP
ncbi:uncharacterized protein LOC128622733 [Ictalurus furcatus]|uniref:uncharacterized protein LOC128622733 n=1 Tax=Ictalurus furcatus TaxID=66913 RepID=UPI0023509E3C|nr:uncharacterized protein LOC128622733 [Ictalurus furcatus]